MHLKGYRTLRISEQDVQHAVVINWNNIGSYSGFYAEVSQTNRENATQIQDSNLNLPDRVLVGPRPPEIRPGIISSGAQGLGGSRPPARNGAIESNPKL